MAGDARSHQVRAGAKQGYNCFLYFHFPPLSATMNKVSLPRNKRLQGMSVCVCVCARSCCLSSNVLTDREQGSQRNCHSSGQRSHRSGGVSTGIALFLLPCFVFLPLHYSEPGNRGDHLQPAPNMAQLNF